MSVSPLPDLCGLARVSPETWQEFGRRLRDAGFDSGFLRAVWPGSLKIYGRLQTAVRTWRAHRLQSPAAYAYRAFVLRDPVSTSEASELMGGRLLDQLVEAGLLDICEPGRVASLFDCRFFMGRLILCDNLAHQGDAVFGSGPGTEAFTGISRARLAGPRVLDVGCGAGAAALWMASRAGQVVATDINPRALEFVRINAAINGVTNVDTQEGDLFESVAGEEFDLIVSQPPFVPAYPGSAAARYRNAGPLGGEVVRRLLATLPEYLTNDGRAVVVFEHAELDDAGAKPPGCIAAGTPDLRAVIIAGAEVDADAYSVRYASQELNQGLDRFDAAATGMREHLARLGIRGVRPAICVATRANQSSAWIQTAYAGTTLWDEVQPGTLDRLLTGHALVADKLHGFSEAPIRLPDSTYILRQSAANDPEIVQVALPQGYVFGSIANTEDEWQQVQAWQRNETGLSAELIARMARMGMVDA